MGELSDWAKKQSPFITIDKDESILVKYMGFKMVPNRFDVDKETVRYLFELPDGEQKPWENGQLQVAKVFDEIEKGTWVKITRTGEATKTRYEIEEVDSKGNVLKKAKQAELEETS
jgi:hypothetical protein